MRILDSAIFVGRSVNNALHTLLGGSIRTHFQLESPADHPDLLFPESKLGHTFVTLDGSLVSFMRVNGALGMGGDENQRLQIEGLFNELSALMATGDYEISTVFVRSKERTKSMLKGVEELVMSSVDRYGLNREFIEELIGEQHEILANRSSWEDGLISFKTKASSLKGLVGTEARKNLNKKRAAARPDEIFGSESQDYTGVIDGLVSRHASAVAQLQRGLAIRETRVSTRLLGWYDALHALRSLIDPDTTGDSWKARILGDKVTKRPEARKHGTMDNYWHDSLQAQIFSDQITSDEGIAKHGNRYFSTVFITMEPEQYTPINRLFQNINKDLTFWSTCHLFGGESEAKGSIQSRLALSRIALLGQSNPTVNALETLESMAKESAVQMTNIRVSFTISGSDKQAVNFAMDDLCGRIQAWGNTQCIIERGDAAEALMCSLPACNSDSMPGGMVVPFKAALYFMPLARPYCPWDGGTFTARTPEGKVFSYKPGSTLVQNFNELVIGPSGSGKSNHLARLLLATVFSPGLADIPYYGMIDVGPSQRGVIELINDLMPSSGDPVGVYVKWRNHEDYAKNPFDTQLGVREPLPGERAFIVDFLSLMFTPSEMVNGAGIPHMASFCSLLVDEAYRYFNQHSPVAYSAGIEFKVDRFVQENAGWASQFEARQINTGIGLSWWDIVDEAMRVGDYVVARRAQVHAVPTVLGLPSVIAESDLIQKTFASNPEILDYARLGVRGAASLYPVLTSYTRFELSGRIVCIDLNEVVRTEGAEALKQSGLMALLARQILVSPLLVHEDDILKEFPHLYSKAAAEYHLRNFHANKATHKQIQMDEYHRFGPIKIIPAINERDMREWRKYKIYLRLSSQSEVDFTMAMIEQCSAIWILAVANDAAANRIIDLLGLTRSEAEVLHSHVRGITSNGSQMMLWARTKEATFTQALISSAGPLELWNTSTTDEDNTVSRAVYKVHGRKLGTKALTKCYPKGSITGIVDAKMQSDPSCDKLALMRELAARAVAVGYQLQ